MIYWIYLAIFVFAVLTPKIVQQGAFFLPEEDVEALLIFGFGTVGFLFYLAKEKALLKAFAEKLHLQKQTNIITRDLSDSYSYIGEMNRKFDIVKDLVFRLPKDTADAFLKDEKRGAGMYRPIIEAVRLLSKTNPVSIRFVNLKTKTLEKKVEDGNHRSFTLFEGEALLQPKKLFCEENGCVIVRSPRQACGVTAFLIFPKTVNRVEDVEIFKIIASEALFLYCVEQEHEKNCRRIGN